MSSMTTQRLLVHTLVVCLIYLSGPCVAGTKAEPATFRDVTKTSGIHFNHTSGASTRKYYVEAMGSGAVFFDYDNDGYLDLYLVNTGHMPGMSDEPPPPNALYRNNADGTFKDVTSAASVGHTGYGMGAAAADYDNDGDQDLYIANYGPDVLYQNNGDGTFTDVSSSAGITNELWGIACAYLDYDKDGDLDIFVVNYLEYDFTVPSSTYRGMVGYATPRLFLGTPDVLYRNNGNGTFTDVAQEAGLWNALEGKGMGAVVGDFDNDELPDIYVTNDTCRNFLYHNDGDGTFTDVAIFAGAAYDEHGLAKGSMGVDCGDYDNDGWLDICIACAETNTLYHNNGDGTFIDETVMSRFGDPSQPILVGYAPLFLDYDNDSDLDIFVANGHFQDIIEFLEPRVTYAQSDQLYGNNGDGTFMDMSSALGDYFRQRYVGRGAAAGDYDNDGDTDVLVLNSNQRTVLLRNEGGNQNNWVQFRLIGKTSNRDAIGARIEVSTGELTQTKEVKSGSSYASGSDLRLLFGLRQADIIDSVEIHWPSGIHQSLHGVGLNQLIEVVEPD